MESRETDSAAGRSETPVSSSAGEKLHIPENSVSCPPAEKPSDAGYPEGFVLLTDVVPNVILDIRYCSDYNFVGERIDGYDAPVALLTKEAAETLKKVSLELAEQGYLLKIFDAYRPQRAVDHFVLWSKDESDDRMKDVFYPNLEKKDLFSLGYVDRKSAHSRGSTVDLTLADRETGEEIDMGSPFDFFGEISRPDSGLVTAEQRANRMILRNAMTAHGFLPVDGEWWHFKLANEPYPKTYFDFPVGVSAPGGGK
ncbi:MAG: M15 family metallopeptidase [Clostridia bacterium]|nr:M15 family metallopeptidase [Clostridia bacterium]